MNFYEVLGVNRDATPAEIKKAYRKKAAATHPDHGGSEETFKNVQEAYRVLSDTAERAYYDQHGEPMGGAKDQRRNELMQMLVEVGGLVAIEMTNPDTQDFLKLLVQRLKASIENLQDHIDEATKAQDKLRRVKKRLRVRRGENTLAEIIQMKIDGLTAELAKASSMKQAFFDGIAFLADYDYEVTKLLMTRDLSEVYERERRGEQFFTFDIRPRGFGR